MPKLIDLTGKRFERLIVIERDFSKSTKATMWLCRCDCGKTVIVNGKHLKSGHSKSCGCLQKEKAANTMKKIVQPISIEKIKQDLTNQRFGFLTVIEYSHNKNKKRIWKCQCDCGNITYVSGSDLKTQHTMSCGCFKSSRGEYIINQLLQNANIPFVREQMFDDCLNKKKLRFDFYVNNLYLIEFDGIQHFEPIELWGGDESLIKNQKRDIIKNIYCQNNNIPLIRIPYTKIDTITIEDLLLETTKYRVV